LKIWICIMKVYFWMGIFFCTKFHQDQSNLSLRFWNLWDACLLIWQWWFCNLWVFRENFKFYISLQVVSFDYEHKVKINELVVLEKSMKSYSIQPLFHTLLIPYLFVHSHLIVIHKVSQKHFINCQNSKTMDTKFARAKIDCDCVHLIVTMQVC
jgi:hypothetical protein